MVKITLQIVRKVTKLLKIVRFSAKIETFHDFRVPAGLNFGFGFGRVPIFSESSGSGLSGFNPKVRVLGFSGTRPGTNW